MKLIKSEPGRYSFSSFCNSTATHFAGELFNAEAGAKMPHVSYRGCSATMPDLVGGQITVAFDTEPAGTQHAKAGKVRILAVVGDRRSPAARRTQHGRGGPSALSQPTRPTPSTPRTP